MKETLVLSVAVAVTSTMYSAANNSNPQEEQPVVGMTNSASGFCVRQSSRLKPEKDVQGNEYAFYHLPDGTVTEEWEYFRKYSRQIL